MRFLQAGRALETLTLRGGAPDHMDCIIAFFCGWMTTCQAPEPSPSPWPSAVVTLGLRHALKGVGNRALIAGCADYRPLFPTCPSAPGSSPVHDPSGLDAALLGGSHPLGAIDPYGIDGSIRYGRPQLPADRAEGASNHAGWWAASCAGAEPVRLGCV